MKNLFSSLYIVIQRLFFLLRVSVLIKKNLFKQAEQICLQYIKKHKFEFICHQYLAKIYKEQQIFAKAIQEYEIIIKRNKGSIADYFDLIPLLFQLANYSRVISLCEELLKSQKNKVEEIAFRTFLDDTYWYLGMSNYSLQDFKKSKYFFNKIQSEQFKRQHNVEKYVTETPLNKTNEVSP